MATSSKLPYIKAGLLDEIQALNVASDPSSAPVYVQSAYSKPHPQDLRAECVYFQDGASLSEDAEQRLSGTRQRRFFDWELELIIDSKVVADAEKAEIRAFAISGAIEDFLASNPKPADWSNSSVDSSAISIFVSNVAVDSTAEDSETRVQVILTLAVKERLV